MIALAGDGAGTDNAPSPLAGPSLSSGLPVTAATFAETAATGFTSPNPYILSRPLAPRSWAVRTSRLMTLGASIWG